MRTSQPSTTMVPTRTPVPTSIPKPTRTPTPVPTPTRNPLPQATPTAVPATRLSSQQAAATEAARKKLLDIAKLYGAGSHVVDDIVSAVASQFPVQKPGVPHGGIVDCTTPFPFLKTAATARLGFKSMTAQQKNIVMNNIQNAMKSATCPSGAKLVSTKSFGDTLRSYQPRLVVAFVKDSTSTAATFEFFDAKGAKQTKSLTFVDAAIPKNKTANLTLHADGNVSFVSWRSDALVTATVKSVAPVGNVFNVVFGTSNATYAAYPMNATATVGETAQVFVGGNKVTHFVRWVSRAATMKVTVQTVKPIAAGGFAVTFAASPPTTQVLATQVKTRVFVGDSAEITVANNVVTVQKWVNVAKPYSASVATATKVTDATYKVLFANPRPAVAGASFKDVVLTRQEGIKPGDAASLFARLEGSSLVVVEPSTLKWTAQVVTQPPTDSPTPSETPMDDVTGQPILTDEPGITINIKGDTNANTNTGAAETVGGGGGPFYVADGLPVVPIGTEAPEEEATEMPLDATMSPYVDPASSPATCTVSCPGAPACPEGLSGQGSFFCMTKRTFIIVVIMFVVACCLVSLGYWMYRKRMASGAGGGLNANAGGGLGDLGPLDLGPGAVR